MHRITLISTLAALLIDQISKWVVVFGIDLRNQFELEVFPPYLNFRMAWNYGVNFGLFSGDSALQRWLLIGFAVAVSAAVAIWLRRTPLSRFGHISGGLLIGGALSNALDRAIYGAVADFLNMSCCGLDNPFAFNLADVFIFAGAIGLVFFSAHPNPVTQNRE